MDMVTVFFIAIGLAMDACGAAVTSGIAMEELRIKNALKIAISFGSFQAVMPVIGWLAGLSLRELISGVDHWVAFGLLILIGGKMIYEAVKASKREIDPVNIYVLLMLSVATSIDALAVGVSFAFLQISIATPIIIIGTVTFVLSLIGVFIGNRLGRFFKNIRIEIVGGLILIGMGVKILIEHLG